jgi:deoxycytidine triphosphate deaminase
MSRWSFPTRRRSLPSIYANEGACQFLFLKGNEPCETSYADRAGKYMGQRGVTFG